MDEETKKRFAELEARITTLEARVKKDGVDIDHYIIQHSEVHCDLDKMIYPSYFRTHPEFCSDMDKFDEIVAGKIDKTNKPKG